MRKLLFILFLIGSVLQAQTPIRTRQLTADSVRLKNLAVHPDSMLGYGTFYAKGDSAWFSDQDENIYNLLNNYTNDSVFFNYVQSGGRLTGGTITATSPADGTVQISAFTCLVHISETLGDSLVYVSMPAQAGPALTDNQLNYIYFDYNGGTPQYAATTDRTTIHEYDQFTFGRVYREGTDTHITQSGTNIFNAYRRIHNRLVKKYGFDWASGSTVSESDTRKLAITSGVWYIGNTEIPTTGYDTNVSGTFVLAYTTDGGTTWTSSDATQLGNTQYNNTASGLADISAPYNYANYWVYMCPEGKMYVLYGQNQYKTLAEAIATSSPALVPNYISVNTHLVARITFLKNATNFAQITNAHTTTIPSASVSLHNNLGNLAWSSSGHTGTASNLGGFDGTGVAAYFPEASYVTFPDSLTAFVTPTQLTDSLNIVRDTTNDHYPRIVALESKALSVQNIWVKDADSTVSSYYPVNLSAFRLLPDSRYTTESISVRNALNGDTLSMSKVIGDRRIDMDYGVSDGAGGLSDYGKKIDGSLSISGNITAANLDNFFETELTVDSQNNLAVGFILPSTAKVFYNGWIIPTSLWSGEGTTTLTLALDTRKYDTVIITN
jgi:hypothetical protein